MGVLRKEKGRGLDDLVGMFGEADWLLVYGLPW